MANPQVENGYTKISNELMDALVRYRIPGEQRQILDFIIRKTYGFCKKNDQISLSQFVEATGIIKQNAKRAINDLLSKKIIVVIKNDYGIAQVYEFNKNYEEWKPLSKKITLSKLITPVIKNDYKSNQKRVPQKKKETITKENAIPTPEWLDLQLWEDFKIHRKKLRKPMTTRAEELLLQKLTFYKNQGHNPRHMLMESIERGWLSVFEPKDN
jgi:phage replication O-like protein O